MSGVTKKRSSLPYNTHLSTCCRSHRISKNAPRINITHWTEPEIFMVDRANFAMTVQKYTGKWTGSGNYVTEKKLVRNMKILMRNSDMGSMISDKKVDGNEDSSGSRIQLHEKERYQEVMVEEEVLEINDLGQLTADSSIRTGGSSEQSDPTLIPEIVENLHDWDEIQSLLYFPEVLPWHELSP